MSRRKDRKSQSANGKLISDLLVKITFEQFFHSLLRQNMVQPHHKSPLREFFKENNKLEATEEEFLDLFTSY